MPYLLLVCIICHIMSTFKQRYKIYRALARYIFLQYVNQVHAGFFLTLF